jgi:hypothetical protein
MNRIGDPSEPCVVHAEGQRQDGQRRDPDDPPRHVPDQPVAPILETAPLQRQLRRRVSALGADLPIQVLLQIGELLVTALEHLVLAGEAEREDQVLQLHQVDVPGRIHGDPIEHLEELFAAPGLAVQRDEQRVLRPFALRTPRRRQDRLVEAGAQRISRRQHDLVADAGTLGVLLEPTDLLEGMTAKP